MADDADVPPLEDMSSVLEKVLSSRNVKTDDSCSNRRPAVGSSTVAISDASDEKNMASVAVSTQVGEDISNRSLAKAPCENSKNAGFGGMKKGFLFNHSSNMSEASKCEQVVPAGCSRKSEVESIPFISANKDSTASQHRFDDVQEAMQVGDAFAVNKEWLTDDLLKQIQSSDNLCQRLRDPTFMQAIAEFQSSPQAAVQKYGNNPTMQAFFQELWGILGEHFGSLGNKPVSSASNTTTSGVNKVHIYPPEDIAEISVSAAGEVKNDMMTTDAEDARVREILSDSKMREILMDSRIQQLMACLRSKPDKAQMLLQNADNDLRDKVDCLIHSGLLQLQS